LALTVAYNEKELFSQIAAGNEAAFEKIFHTYNAKLLPFVSSITKNREVAEEVMQEVFLKLWLQRETLTQIENPAAWLVRLSSNLALNYLQHLAVHTKVVNRLKKETTPESATIEEDIDIKKVKQHIATAISSMPEKRQEIYRLSREQGLNRKQIADKLGVSESTVKNQMSSALKHIQEFIEKHYGIYLPLILLVNQHFFS
jgi:RNA polymerase sigma-70 factor (family 1)